MNSVLGRKYARALLDLAEAQKVTDAVHQDLGKVTALLKTQPSLRDILETPKVKSQAKEEMVVRLFERQVSSLALHFLRLVARNQRFAWWDTIAETFTKLMEERRGLARGVAVTSEKWDDADVKKLAKGFSEHVGRQVELIQRVDPAVLGGVAIHLDSQVYDGTHRRRLWDIQQHLISVS